MKKFIIKYLPYLGKYKRYLVAFLDSIKKTRESYSQFGEDRELLMLLKEYNIENSIYIDVGANHPTDISNTYLLYRSGYRGILIEPNIELHNLAKKFRPKDLHLGVGCGNQNIILPFNISKTPVLSSFKSLEGQDHLYKIEYLPIMKLDNILSSFNDKYEYYFLLSIDVEGMNYEVLKGAQIVLMKTLFLLIEFDNNQDKSNYISLISNSFDLIKEMGCNQLYINRAIDRSLINTR